MYLHPSIETRFWAKVNKTETCWLWTASTVSGGYGYFVTKKPRHEYAHRYSWFLANGEIPDGLLVLHHCDVRGCVNPDHLFLGTQRDNIHDMISKGRQMDYTKRTPREQKGSRNSMSKLTEDQVAEIRARRASGEGPVALAREFGITYGNIWKILTGRSW